MKKILLIFSFILLVVFNTDAGHFIQKFTSAVSADCDEYFTGANTDDVDGNTDFDAESDPGSEGWIISNEYRIYAATVGNDTYVTESSGCMSSATELTIKFKIKFEDITNVASGTDDLQIIELRNSAQTAAQRAKIWTSSNNIDNYYVQRGPSDEDGNTVTMIGLAADIWYDAYFYAYIHASNGTVAMKIGSWAESNTGLDDTSGYTNLDMLQFGAPTQDWGDGSTDTYIYFDDFEIYFSDER